MFNYARAPNTTQGAAVRAKPFFGLIDSLPAALVRDVRMAVCAGKVGKDIKMPLIPAQPAHALVSVIAVLIGPLATTARVRTLFAMPPLKSAAQDKSKLKAVK